MAYTTLHRYLQAIKFWPRVRGPASKGEAAEIERWPKEMDWILFPSSFEPYSVETMLQPLLALIGDKLTRYATIGHGFDSLHLIVYYHSALLYNSPFRSFNFGMTELLNAVRASIGNEKGPFEKIFLFIAVDDGEVFQLA